MGERGPARPRNARFLYAALSVQLYTEPLLHPTNKCVVIMSFTPLDMCMYEFVFVVRSVWMSEVFSCREGGGRAGGAFTIT